MTSGTAARDGKPKRLVLAVLCLTILCPATSFATEAKQHDAVDDWELANLVDFYLTAMRVEREKLRSGEFAISGSRSLKYPARPDAEFAGAVLISCAFDETRIRMDSLEPGSVPELPLTKPVKMVPGRIQRKHFHTPELNAAWRTTNGDNAIELWRSDRGPLGGFLPFDIRAMGLATWEPFIDRQNSTISSVVEVYQHHRWQKAVDLSHANFEQLVFHETTNTMSREVRYWLRRDQGLTPVRFHVTLRPVGFIDEKLDVDEHADIGWEQINGVRVPVALEITAGPKWAEQRISWKIRWRSVNKPIDDRLFSWEDFGAPPDVPVFDCRNDDVVEIRRE